MAFIDTTAIENVHRKWWKQSGGGGNFVFRNINGIFLYVEQLSVLESIIFLGIRRVVNWLFGCLIILSN
jgi:hypothetical protein